MNLKLHAVAKQETKPQEPEFLRQRVDSYYRDRAVNPVSGGHLLRGRTPASGDLSLASNDYLSIARHADIMGAQQAALEEQGHGILRSSVFIHGACPLRGLESAMADAFGAEDALIAQSGWCANTGLIQSIVDESRPVYLDMFAHMSLWEGVKSAGATPRPFRHNNAESLAQLIAKHGPGLVIVDSVYSTNGHVCPLVEIVDVATQNDCIMLVDESHSLGIFGPQGSGMVADLGLLDKVHFRTASLSKAFASRGGVILGSARNMEFVKYHSLPAIFSSGLLPHEIAGLRATIDVIQTADDLRRQVLSKAAYLRRELTALGYDVGHDASQIIALTPGPEHQTMVLRDALESRGVFGAIFCAPATPRNRSLIRFTINAAHSMDDLRRVVQVCGQIRDEIDLGSWPQSRRAARAA